MSSSFLSRLQERRPYKDHSSKELQWKHSAGHNSDKLKNEGLQTGWKHSHLFRKLEHLHVPGYLQHGLFDLKSTEPQWEVERRRRLFREADLVEKHLKEGYQQEALLLHSSLKNLKHQYLIQQKDLELRLSEAELERDWAKQQSLAAYSEHEVLLQEHHALLRELRNVRERLEQEEAWYGHDEPVSDRTNWKGVQQSPWWYR
ncbi:uncharacterized protein LOC114668127 [Erpetoichthys calabaricus]|uniref:uncharacterized protein LOC114668127 n=1 Tax=Erpetoichthys calabaricus TaxID=27687 RepID=UPI0010A0AB3F|nr:uncharacterized protein LOC114668127 [Erpetoichthys calabaricus]XP_051776804.1 uncharacterized protein LOC114668127 [Erpetoichthys calabaricus]XP_051776805.1 uncharacterized protein LOC114668127 [Erpetoichthys calabaricus]